MTRRALVVLSFLGACAGPTVRLPADVRPRMAALRLDAAAIATRIDREMLRDAVPAADRLARIEFTGADYPPEFLSAAQDLRVRGRELLAALAANDSTLARERFDAVARTCTECHRRFRPAGVAAIDLELDPR